jgi:hypothetical protein
MTRRNAGRNVKSAAMPKMSSCQFLLAAGEFDQLSIQSNGIALGVVATLANAVRGALRSQAQRSCCVTSTIISA